MSFSVLIIGAGNMGGSLARGLKEDSDSSLKFHITDVHPDKLKNLEKLGVPTVKSFGDKKITADVIVLCVKPQDLDSVAQKLKGKVRTDALIISILAGTMMEDVSEVLGFKGAVVRAMPNIAATVHLAATAMCFNKKCSAKQQGYAEVIFSSVGDAYWADEQIMDAVTGLSGSGPAYIYMVIEALTDGGVKMGIPRDLSAKLAVQTVLGAAQLVKTSGIHPAILKDQVTTPGGTTISAVHELESHGLRPMLISAVVTATERSALLREKAREKLKKVK